MGVTTPTLSKLGLIDEVIPEPSGGAHRDYDSVANAVKDAITQSIMEFINTSSDELVERRYQRIISYGHFEQKR